MQRYFFLAFFLLTTQLYATNTGNPQEIHIHRALKIVNQNDEETSVNVTTETTSANNITKEELFAQFTELRKKNNELESKVQNLEILTVYLLKDFMARNLPDEVELTNLLNQLSQQYTSHHHH